MSPSDKEIHWCIMEALELEYLVVVQVQAAIACQMNILMNFTTSCMVLKFPFSLSVLYLQLIYSINGE